MTMSSVIGVNLTEEGGCIGWESATDSQREHYDIERTWIHWSADD
jgi:hypothetical protein